MAGGSPQRDAEAAVGPVESIARSVWPVIGVGSSAGGLEACQKMLNAMPTVRGLAIIAVQHLEPHHDSLLADLLASHTSLAVAEATEGMPIEVDHLYVIPPGAYLSIRHGVFHLTKPRPVAGTRLPFDVFLHSLVEEYGPRAVCVVLSGTGADGSAGLAGVKACGGWVLAQDPDEARFGGMPNSAIATGLVDRILPVAEIGEALVERARLIAEGNAAAGAVPTLSDADLAAVLQVVGTKTGRDYSAYKPGTLARRIERRLGLAGFGVGATAHYIEQLSSDSNEMEALIDDLLIHVTQFFRDPGVCDYLAREGLPTLIGFHPDGQPIRIWVAGCSTGEEAYSLAMLFVEAIAAARRTLKLQVFATDVDVKALALARDGFFPADIASVVSKERLDRFFTVEENGYRVRAEVREAIVFSVHDVLADPPFSRIDFVSCRNLLIYLLPEAQARAMGYFHFALRPGGQLLLGSAETVGGGDDLFAIISKPAHLYRRIGQEMVRTGNFRVGAGEAVRIPLRPTAERVQRPIPTLATLCERLVIEAFAPAIVLINARHEVLYTLGPTARFLRVPIGYPNPDLLAMLPEGVRSRVRAALLAFDGDKPMRFSGGSLVAGQDGCHFDIEIRAVASEGETLLLLCFIDRPGGAVADNPGRPVPAENVSRIAELEQELLTTRGELDAAMRNMEAAADEQKAINQEALSINEEYQSTNEELLTSKEELQSLNEELIALNGQLQETLERQRTTSNDLQNVLYSTDAATIFLDTKLYIRFFTPAMRSLFNIIPTDVGRPLTDLRSLASDGTLPADAARVLETLAPIEREIEVECGTWFLRRILPYRTENNDVEGVVITFADITASRRAADDLRSAKALAEQANTAKSRFLASASHDLRQPMQTLSLIHGLLGRSVEDERGRLLMARFDDALNAMSAMLNTLLDINQIEAGTVRVERQVFAVADLLDRLSSELTMQAKAKGLAFHYVPSTLWIESDPRLLEQMVRNLLMNALKFTRQGAILLGCRRRGDRLTIDVCDTGIGIPETELSAIFEEYHQVGNVARVPGLGLGLGLSIVERVGVLLGHAVRVRSRLGVGSLFSIEVPVHAPMASPDTTGMPDVPVTGVRSASILLVEDDVAVSDLLALSLVGEGYRVAVATSGRAAGDLIRAGTIRPHLVVADYNLLQERNGVEVIDDIRAQLRDRIPALVLTGDVSTATLADIVGRSCYQLSKPVSLGALLAAIAQLLPGETGVAVAGEATPTPRHSSTAGLATVFVVDDDDRVRGLIRAVLDEAGRAVETFASSEALLAAVRPGGQDCLIVDAYLPGMNGIELLRMLNQQGDPPVSIMITGGSDVRTAVEAMKAGALDFIEKPIGRDMLLGVVDQALAEARDAGRRTARHDAAVEHVAGLTKRQHQIMDLVLAGHPSKNIAADLGISQRTVENHRAAIMRKTGSKSLPELARLAVAAAATEPDS